MFIDTHCHLNLLVKKKNDIPLTLDELKKINIILNNARDAGVNFILTVGTSVIESKNCIKISKKYTNVYSVVGIHPCDCSSNWQRDFCEIKKIVKDKKENKIVGIGETGLDFYHKPFDERSQISAFEKHIELAIDENLPLVVHVRESAYKVLDILNNHKNFVRGVIHCFSENKEFAKRFLDLGFYLGLNAPVTYPKNEQLRDVIKYIPLNKILLETDAPFLPPQQFRGKINLPEYIPLFAKIIANLKGIKVSKLEEITTLNAKELFWNGQFNLKEL